MRKKFKKLRFNFDQLLKIQISIMNKKLKKIN